MKCTVNSTELLGELRAVQARAKIASLDILKHIRFEVTQDRVSLLGHDLDSSSETALDADDTEPGNCAIPCDPLIRLVGGLPKNATVVFDLDGRQVTIKSGRSRYKLPVMDAVDFPQALSAEGGIKVGVTAADLEQLLDRPRAALNPKDERLAFGGVYIHEEAGHLAGVGACGYNMMRFSTDIPVKNFAGVIVPRSSIDEMLKIGQGDMLITQRTISITSGVRTYCSKLIDAPFPESYRKIIPPADGAHISVDRDWFMECLSRLLAVGDFSGVDLIDLSVGAKELTISTIGLADGAETIECDVEGAERKFFCIKTSQLLNGCKALKGDVLHVYVRGEMDPVLLFDPAEASAVNVQMPCLSKNRDAVSA